jgi:hypothetical protein
MFKRYAELFDTASNAKAVGKAVKAHQPAYRLPMSSAELPLQTSEKLDAWGHPYCVSALKTSIVVLSGGPYTVSFSCPKPNASSHKS